MRSKNKKPTKKTKSLNKFFIKFWPVITMVFVLSFFLGVTKYNLSQVETKINTPVQMLEPEASISEVEIESLAANDSAPSPEAATPPPEKPTTETVAAVSNSKKVASPPPQVAPAPTPAPAPQPAPLSATTSETSSSLSYINSLRSSLGKPALTQNATMNQWALAHAQHLAANCKLEHQTLATFLGQNIGPKTVMSIAENVGYASTIQQVLDGLKNSPGHYANMTGDYTYVGLGVVTAGGSCAGYVYTTQMFSK